MADPEDTTGFPEAPEVRIGVYRVLGLLGAGGMGEVFLAFDDRLQRRVAIKRIRSAAAPDERARERLRREAAAAATLNHPAIVQIYDILEEPSGDAIVMEYVEGQTLARLRAKGPLPAVQAIAIARQVAEGLAAAHAVGLIHRDLKTQNVMLTPSGQAKILDFGLAKRLDPSQDEESLTGEGSLLGTLRSMSPEQAQGRELDARSDLFSLGVLLYEICTGRPPFKAETPTQTLMQVITETPPALGDLNPDLPAPLVALIEELMQKDPARRPPNADVVVERLGAMETLPGEPMTRTARARVRGRVLRWPVLGIALLVVAAVVAYLVFWPRPPLQVGVLVLETSPANERTALTTFALRDAILRSLAGLEGIEPMERDDLAPGTLSVQDAARALAADEIVVANLACDGPRCDVSLRRQRGSDAGVIERVPLFAVSSDPEDSLARAANLQVKALFPNHRPRSGSQDLVAQSADYQRYLVLQRRGWTGEVLTEPDIAELERIIGSSPGLSEASILAVSAARTLRDRPRADRILRDAELRHPEEPRLAYTRFLLERELGSLAEAEKAFAELERRLPGDIRTLRARGMLLTLQGKLQEASEVRGRLVRERPSWRNLWFVADVEIEMADQQGARQHLAQLLQVSPGNPSGLEKLAVLEWQMGDPREAARIYEELLQRKVTRKLLSNLGWSRLLARDYSAAAAAYRRALELNPNHLLSLSSLGIAEQGLGDLASAQRHYEDLLARLQARPAGTLTTDEKLLQAEVLARLGRPAEATALMHEALRQADQDPQTIFQLAIISALCGERNTAIVYLTEGRKRGLSASWLGVPGLESLRAVPDFQKLLAAT